MEKKSTDQIGLSNEKLFLKLEMSRDDSDYRRRQLEQAFEAIDKQATMIYQLNINIKPLIERVVLSRATEIQNAEMLDKETKNFLSQYDKFKRKIQGLIENDNK